MQAAEDPDLEGLNHWRFLGRLRTRWRDADQSSQQPCGQNARS